MYLETIICNIMIYHQVPHTVTLECLLSVIPWFRLDIKEFVEFYEIQRDMFPNNENTSQVSPTSNITRLVLLFGFPIFA